MFLAVYPHFSDCMGTIHMFKKGVGMLIDILYIYMLYVILPLERNYQFYKKNYKILSYI